MSTWQAWTQRLLTFSLGDFYAPSYFVDHFPGYMYYLLILGQIYNLLTGQNSLNYGFEIFYKFITGLFDLGSAYFIYLILKPKSSKSALIGSFLYIVTPLTVFNSLVWGQFDGMAVFFLLASCYFLFERKNILVFCLIYSIGLLVKPHGLIAAPVFVVFILLNFKLKKILNFFLIPAVILISSFPFFPENPLNGLFNLLLKSTSIYPYTSIFAYNLWYFLGWWKPDDVIFLSVSYKTWGLFLFSFAEIVILFPLIKNPSQNVKFYFALSLSAFAFFLFSTRVHERYLFPFFAFITIPMMTVSTKKIFYIFGVLSIIHFLNLWDAYYYYQYIYSDSEMGNFFGYPLLLEARPALVLINIALFFMILKIYYSQKTQKLK